MKKSTLLNVLLVGVLIGSIVLVNATHIPINITTDPDEVPEAGEYDPFLDVTGDVTGYPDGKIDMRDIGRTARAFATEGNSVRNVTIMDSGGFCGQQPGVYADVAEITVLEWTIVNDGAHDLGVNVHANSYDCFLHFNFIPKGELVNVTELWIIVTETTSSAFTVGYDIKLNNNVTFVVTSAHKLAHCPVVDTAYTNDSNTLRAQIQPGIHTLRFSNVSGGDQHIWIHKVKVFIGYIYEVS